MDIGGWFSDLGNNIVNLGTTILNGIKSIFIPKDDFLDDKVTSIRNRFSFVDSIIDTAKGIINRINTTKSNSAPKMTLELDIRGEKKNVTIIDMSWYAKFKPYGDIVIGGMIIVFFVWRMFRNAPNIINGVGTSVNDISKL
jgi:hypothetical protein